MKKSLFILALLMPLSAYAQQTAYTQQEVPTDSISSTLDEVVVTADAQIETARKVILRPTKLEKKHSSNGYTLLANMNLPDFNVNASAKTITTIAGNDVRILVNGVDVEPDELATLAASEIMQIDYQRNPGGRYAGCGAVMNFITVQYDYGGNVYLSADEGIARQYGNYTGMVNFKKKALTLTLTANGKWDNSSTLNSAWNMSTLNDGFLNQTIMPVSSLTSSNSQYINFKLADAAENHSFDVSLALTRSATPRNFLHDNISYTGNIYDFSSEAIRQSGERALSPVMKMHYNLYLPGGHTIMAIATLRHGHTNYISRYLETNFDEIKNNTKENNVLASATCGYFKSFSNGLSLGTTLDEYYNYYHDVYSGSFTNKQTLKNNHAMAMLHIDQTLSFRLSYYVSAGITDLYSSIGNHQDNQLTPKAFYGATYAINQKHSLSVTGNYLHSIYNPAYKNDAVIQTSFFEATAGNPELKQLNAFQNMISYNGRAGHFRFSFTYDFLKYFGNTSNRYYAENNIMYHQLVNDGDYYYHKLIFGVSANLISNRLQLRGNATYSISRFNSEYRPSRRNDWRTDFSVSWMFGDWQAKATYATPYSILSIDGITVRNPAQYGLTLGWQKGCWAAECCVDNFLDRRSCTITNADYGVYQSHSHSFSDLKGRNISLSVTYILPYGKKTDPARIQTESSINSAILRPF